MIDEIFIPPTSDLLFKWIFGDERNIDLLTVLLLAVLDLSYLEIEIIDPYLKPDFDRDKLGILDVKARTETGKIIDIEVQIAQTPDIRERILFYISKMLNEQITSGDDYTKIKQVISIIITDYNLIENNLPYHHRFTLFDNKNSVEFSDLVQLHTLELPKLPKLTDGTELYEWLKFLKIRRKEELEMYSLTTQNPAIQKAIGKVREFNADAHARMLAESLEKRERDERSRYNWGLKQQKIEIVKNALIQNLSNELIESITGVPLAEIEQIRADTNKD